MCRAVKVLCVAEDADALAALRQATVAADWELCPGATDLRAALDQIDAERPHHLVAFGDFGELVELVRDRFPGMTIVVDRPTPGATEVATSVSDVRTLLRGSARPGGPVRSG
jgi:predicted lipid carrier protein YhbT